jgi:hypothetical protein
MDRDDVIPTYRTGVGPRIGRSRGAENAAREPVIRQPMVIPRPRPAPTRLLRKGSVVARPLHQVDPLTTR